MLDIDKIEFESLILDGATVKDLQEKYGISRSTVYVYKRKYDLIGVGPHAKVRAADVGNKKCKTCLEVKDLSEFYSNGFASDGKKKYKPGCKVCEREAAKGSRSRKVGEILSYAGRVYACEVCGYSKNTAALCFHHKDPTQKDFQISSLSGTTIKGLAKEIDKCIVLCANCHMEEHYPHLNV